MIADFAYAEGVQAALSCFTKLSAPMNFTRPGAAGIGPVARTPTAPAAPLNVATGPNAPTQGIQIQQKPTPKPVQQAPMAPPIMGGAAAGSPGSVPPPVPQPGIMSQIASGVKDVAGAVAPILAQMPMPGAAPAAQAAPAKGGGMFQNFMNGAKGVAAPEGGSVMHSLGQQAPGMMLMAGAPMVLDALTSKKDNNQGY